MCTITMSGSLILAAQLIGVGPPPGKLTHLPPRQCQPLISGVLWWIDPQTDPPRLDTILDAMDRAGMNLLWLLGTPELAADPDDTTLEKLFTEADRRQWRVIIETSCVPNWFVNWDLPTLKQADRRQVEQVAESYGHHPSFFAWYINYEIYMEWGERSEKIRELYRYIGELTRSATPRAKLTISPFYLADEQNIRGDFRYATPEEYGDWWTETIRQAGIDIVMLQDSGAVHCECVPVSTRAAFFAAMQRACQANGAELWGNVETVEHRAADWDGYARRLERHRAAGTDYPWSFDMARNAIKLDLASRFSTNIVSWGWEYWNPVRPQSQVGESVANYRAYLAYHDAVIARPATRPVRSTTQPARDASESEGL